jgi:mRNA interferase RelE/StbE
VATYRLVIKESAEKQIERLTARIYTAVRDRIFSLRDNPRPRGAKKLVGGIGWRIRVGNYRVIYRINDSEQTVRIMAVVHRQSAYR